MRRLVSTLGALAIASACLGCAGTFSRFDGETSFLHEENDDFVEPEETGSPIDDSQFQYREPTFDRWNCFYDETYNYDWHDDVLCSNGQDSHRPYLLEWADYVSYDDIMNAAAEYEATLNSSW